jgi:hypothetical protein
MVKDKTKKLKEKKKAKVEILKNQEDQSAIHERGERKEEKKERSMATNHTLAANTCRIKRKRTWRHIHQHGERESSTIRRHNALQSKSACIFHTLAWATNNSACISYQELFSCMHQQLFKM